jgi:hypothetical protein
MEKEISSGTMLGIVLIALAAVIGLGFGVFSIAKGVANEGTVGVQDNLGAVSNAAFDDYNDKIVTGTMVQSAINNFRGKSVAIFVNTTAMDKGVAAYVDHASSLNGYLLTNGAAASFTAAKQTLTGTPKGFTKLTAADITSGKHYYVNYNALFDPTSAGSLEFKDGVFTAKGIPFGIEAATGKVQYDFSVGGLTRSGNCEYLNATAKFDANLIKDETGVILGVVFTQRAQ